MNSQMSLIWSNCDSNPVVINGASASHVTQQSSTSGTVETMCLNCPPMTSWHITQYYVMPFNATMPCNISIFRAQTNVYKYATLLFESRRGKKVFIAKWTW